jgi:tetratricopeptide (TPR) repeat protein
LAVTAYQVGESASSDYCFPNTLDDILVLRAASETINGSKAPYYLGCLFYDKLRTDVAIKLWEKSRDLDPDFPTVHRNLALAYYNKLNDPRRASIEMEQAFSLDATDSRVFLELDQLHRKLGWTYAQRLEEFEKHLDVVEVRDDLFIEYLTVLNLTGNYEKAFSLMARRHFHPWEGGEGKVTAQYRIGLTLMAKDAMAQKNWRSAEELLKRAQAYPHNLGEGKLEGQKDNDLHYYLGIVERELGNVELAAEEFTKATHGPDEVKGAMYYNDQPAEMILFQGLAHEKLGQQGAANARFYRLLDYGEQHLDDKVSIDYFAVSLPDFLIFENDYTKMNRVHCLYLMALANIGLGESTRAKKFLDDALALDPSHIQANVFKDELEERHIL